MAAVHVPTPLHETPRMELDDLKAALDAHAIVAITDARGRITYVNDKFCEISQYSREELVGQDHRMINSDHHPKTFFAELWATIGSGRIWQGQIKNRAKDGSFYWVDTTIVPFLNPDGRPRQYIAIRADITRRVQAEASRARLAAIVDSSDDAIIGKDLEGTITSWNGGAERVFGYSAAEAVGHSMLMIFPPELAPEEAGILRRIGAGESIDHHETERICKDGRRITVALTISPVRDDRGVIVGASKIARDITAQKQAEARIHQMAAELERRVAERTAELEAANRELEAFSYSVSHDLRAPLRAMNGFSQAVIEDYGALLPEEGRTYLERIRGGAQRMGDLIDDLLAFSRLSRLPLKTSRIDTDGLIGAVLTELGAPWPDRRVEIVRGRLPECEGDVALLRQVWVNLLGNALKYTGRCETARIEIGSRQDEHGLTEFYVRDNGAGFDMRYAEKLFGVFSRLHRMEDYPGTGVGLAIVQRIVHRHGGTVGAEAEVGRGACFHFTLASRSLS